MQKTTVAVGLAFLIAVFGRIPADAGHMTRANISVEYDAIFGETVYEIGNVVITPDKVYRVHFPISRLEFPLNIQMLTLKAGFYATRGLQFQAGWSRNLTSDPGHMLDFDWLSPGTLNIYSESMLEMDAEVFSGNLRYTVFSTTLERYSRFFRKTDRWSLFAGAGYRHQIFNFSASNTCQTYPAGRYHDDFDSGARVIPKTASRALCSGDYYSGLTLTYSVEYSIPYLEIGFWMNQGVKSTAEFSLGYSPIVKARDEDHHLLRDMRAGGNCDGTAFLLSIFYRYFWTNHWFSSLHLNYTAIETEGSSQTFIDDIWSHTIDQEINSEQIWVGIEIGRAF